MKRSRKYLAAASFALMTTTIVLAGTANSNAQNGGPYNSSTIHQSAGGRDSRGFPKYYQHPQMSGAYASTDLPVRTRGIGVAGPQHDFQLEGRGLGEVF